ncbi:MAG: hypothetical protein WC711_04060 [Candidatus Staskawiczbacteria bacterium]|jgi:hypothetical protein
MEERQERLEKALTKFMEEYIKLMEFNNEILKENLRLMKELDELKNPKVVLD